MLTRETESELPLPLHETLERLLAILRYVEEHPGCSLKELSEALGIAPSTLRVLVDALEKAGMLTREVGDMPRRSKIKLTPKGSCIVKCTS